MNEEELKNNDELDELKALWQSQQNEKLYDSDKIFKMLHRKSINSVQWLFLLTIIELVIGLAITLWSYLSGNHYFSKPATVMIKEESIQKLENFSNLGFVFSLILMGIIFYYYRKISSDLSVSMLIENIIKFRKTVILCLVCIVIILMVFLMPVYFELGKNIAIQNMSDRTEEFSPEKIKSLSSIIGWIVAAGSAIIFSILSFVYYFVVYGFFLRRLKKNLNELREIDK